MKTRIAMGVVLAGAGILYAVIAGVRDPSAVASSADVGSKVEMLRTQLNEPNARKALQLVLRESYVNAADGDRSVGVSVISTQELLSIVKGIYVFGEAVGDPEGLGVTGPLIKTIFEERLRKHGVPVCDDAQWTAMSLAEKLRCAKVYLHVIAIYVDDRQLVIGETAWSLMEPALLLAPDTLTFGVTKMGGRESPLAYPVAEFKKQCVSTVEGIADDFVTAWKAAHEKGTTE